MSVARKSRAGRTVILAAGEFPRRGGAGWAELAAAVRVIACDSAAGACRRRLGRWPDVIVGDMDSFRGRSVPVPVVSDPDQETNDLTKAIRYAKRRGWTDLAVVGATGRREDHSIGNVFRSLEERVELVTDHGTFHPVCGRRVFAVRKGTGVSVFAPDVRTRLTSRGLQWPLDGVVPDTVYRMTLNRASASRFSVTSDRPAYVFIESGGTRTARCGLPSPAEIGKM